MNELKSTDKSEMSEGSHPYATWILTVMPGLDYTYTSVYLPPFLHIKMFVGFERPFKI